MDYLAAGNYHRGSNVKGTPENEWNHQEDCRLR
jgi:hypothetical protein